MKNAIIIHGMPDREEHYKVDGEANSNKHWLPWLQHELILKDILAQTPEMPLPFRPVYEDWEEVFRQFDLHEETMLIGHSCGAGFLIRYLSENNINVGRVALVAPWIDPDHTLDTGFFDFQIDSSLLQRTKGLKVFYSTDDSHEITDGVKILREKLVGATFQEFHDKGHFCFEDLHSHEFPELRDYLLFNQA